MDLENESEFTAQAPPIYQARNRYPIVTSEPADRYDLRGGGWQDDEEEDETDDNLRRKAREQSAALTRPAEAQAGVERIKARDFFGQPRNSADDGRDLQEPPIENAKPSIGVEPKANRPTVDLSWWPRREAAVSTPPAEIRRPERGVSGLADVPEVIWRGLLQNQERGLLDGPTNWRTIPTASVELADAPEPAAPEIREVSAPRDTSARPPMPIPAVVDAPANLREPNAASAAAAPPAPLDIFDKWRDVKENPIQLAPFAGGAKELYDLGHVGLAAYRLSEADQHGADADPQDIQLVKAFVDHQARDTTFGYKVGSVLAALPSFAGELLATGGLYTAGEKVALKAGQKALAKLGSEAGAELLERVIARAAAKHAGEKVAGMVGRNAAEKALEFGARAAGTVAGAAAQTVPAAGLRIASETIQRMLPEFQFSENEKGELAASVTRQGDDFGPAMAKAFGNQFTEVMSEHTGGALAFVPGADKLRLMKTALMKRWFGLNPEAQPGAFTRLVRQIGWHGVMGEMFEERVGDAAKSALGLQSWKDAIPTPEQLLVEAVSFSVPGAIENAGRAVVNTRQNAPSAVPFSAPAEIVSDTSEPHVPAHSRAIAPADERNEGSTSRTAESIAPSVETVPPAGASPTTVEPTTMPAHGDPEPNAELVARERELAELPATAAPFQRALIEGRIRALREQIAQGPTNPGSTADPTNAVSVLETAAWSSLTGIPQLSDGPQQPIASPTAQPEASRPHPNDAAEHPWGHFHDGNLGKIVENRQGRHGTILRIEKGLITARHSDGSTFTIYRPDARLVSSDSPPTIAHNHRQGLLPTQFAKNIREYLRAIEKHTGFRLPRVQREHLKAHLRSNAHSRMSHEESTRHRDSFTNRIKNALIVKWEYHTGLTWPRYTQSPPRLSSSPSRKHGYRFDAHHIIENVYGGPHEWWNLTPASFPSEHQSGLHLEAITKSLFP